MYSFVVFILLPHSTYGTYFRAGKVYDHLAIHDATAIFRFLVKRGYIKSVEVDLEPSAESVSPLISDTPPLLRESSPLSGVDMVEV